MLLAGDIGATKTRLGFFPEQAALPPSPQIVTTFENARYPNLETIIADFIDRHPAIKVSGACFGIAGPVFGTSVTLPNLSWLIDANNLAVLLKITSVLMINDLLAVAAILPQLPPEDLYVLNPGLPTPGGNIAVIAPGTGLGEAFLIWDGQQYRGYASEGGHGDFAPRNAEEVELLQHLRQTQEHVSYDHLCSGRGIAAIYHFLKATRRATEPLWLAKQLAEAKDTAPLIVQGALAEKDRPIICVKTVEMFASILGAAAGNLALHFMALGGIYLAGGIPPRIQSFLTGDVFLESFRSKGRMSDLVARVPVRLVLNERAPLLGAAYYAIQKGLA